MEIKTLHVVNQQQKKVIFMLNNKIFKAYVTQDTIYLYTAGQSFTINILKNIAQEVIPTKNQEITFTPANQELVLKSPLAGLVVKIKAQVGQFVEKNQPLIVIESMKMENEISAPFSAFIKTISISEGNLVKPNQVIVIFERRGEKNATTKNYYEQKIDER